VRVHEAYLASLHALFETRLAGLVARSWRLGTLTIASLVFWT
jgi:hypothetical protein